MVASGLSGPARASVGAVRDYVLGLRFINGRGEHLTFGGQVMKNVAGYDVSRLLAGSWGTLGLITEVSLKVLPIAPAEAFLMCALPQAQALINRFGSFTRVLAAPPEALLAAPDIGLHAAAAVKIVQVAALRMMQADLLEQPLLNNWERLMGYLTAALSREKIEQFRVLFLDSKNRLIADEAQARGTVNHTPVYPREVVKRALELHATALILVHNHPSGDPTPSRADIEMTAAVKDAAAVLEIVVHDHLILGNGKWTSFRREGLL
jgi:DNA repair protein RadC